MPACAHAYGCIWDMCHCAPVVSNQCVCVFCADLSVWCACAECVYECEHMWIGLHVESPLTLVPLLFVLVSCEQFD